MANFAVLLLVVQLCFSLSASLSIEPPKNENIPQSEQNCALQGGYCVLESDCPESAQTVVKGLCPKQQKLGVECCYELPAKNRICESVGGECLLDSECNGIRDIARCPNSDQVCCNYVT